ncbi:hypothetical protein niasHT_001943 [Heterodera trifolii]|uniref:Carbonyl reductase n=1 Tax=Heterodera trifolii TaxID=157864 RepID=A0ABD2M6A5_9BILA
MAGKIFVVTGANKGIGYGIARGLAQQVNGATIYMTARTPSLGEKALEELEKDLGTKRTSKLAFHQLDITDEKSCADFAAFLKKTHGGLDVLINNAGFAYKQNATESAATQADVTIGVNYYGTKLVTDQLGPLIRDGGRIVNVCSQMGVMGSQIGVMGNLYKQALIDQFKRDDFTLNDIDTFVEEYKKLAHADKRKEGGYPESAYCVSKAAEIALSVLQAREFAKRNIVVNACCPGYVDTDMTSHKGHLTVDQGADTPIFLAIDQSVQKGGLFYFQRKPITWLQE